VISGILNRAFLEKDYFVFHHSLLGCSGLCIVLLCPSFASAEVRLDVKGLNGELEDNVALYIQQIDKSEYAASSRFEYQVEDEIKQGIMPFGYYNPSVDFTQKKSGDDTTIIAIVDKGKPTKYATVNFVIKGEGADDPAFQVVYKLIPDVGEQLNHATYSAIKSKLASLSMQRGYFFAQYEKRQLDIAPHSNQAFLDIEYNTGKRHYFGPVTYKGSQIQEQRLRSMLPFKEGDPYLSSQLGVYNKKLSNSGWFSSVLVKGDIKNLEQGELPIDVRLKPAKLNTIETGIGYVSDIGPRFKLGWDKPWLNDKGHSFSSDIEWSSAETDVTATYKIPLDNVEKDYYQFPMGYQKVDNEDTYSESYRFGLERHWILDSGWHRKIGLTYMFDDFTQGVQTAQTHYLVPSLSYSRTKTDRNSPIKHGNKYLISLDGAAEDVVSDGYFARLQATGSWVQSLSTNQRGLAALRTGAIAVDNIQDLPPSLRFFAGGSNSIRGYDYDGIAPKDSGGYLMGGKYKATASLEYQYRVTGDWWVATFFDAGSVWNETPELYRGVGLGLRWISPVGPLRLDFAYGLDDVDDGGGFHFYFSLGPEL